MNYNEALISMMSGAKVKLPEWTGYWFVDYRAISAQTPNEGSILKMGVNAEALIRVFTKDGDILDTPWIEKYKDRTDFEVTEGKLGFDFAILALKNGKRVMRKGWNGKGMYLILFEGQKDIARKLGYGFGEMVGEFMFVDVIAIKSAQNEMVLGWHPSTPDMLSMDWELFPEQL